MLRNKQYTLQFPPEHSLEDGAPVRSEESLSDGRLTIYYAHKTQTILKSGAKRDAYKSGYQVFYFDNGDVRQRFPCGKTVYFYAETETTETEFPDGLKVLLFKDGQLEQHKSDGSVQIYFKDGTQKLIPAAETN